MQKTMVNIVRPCWISQLDPFNGRWHLSEKGKLHGQFDAIVIAHNGKLVTNLNIFPLFFHENALFLSFLNDYHKLIFEEMKPLNHIIQKG